MLIVLLYAKHSALQLDTTDEGYTIEVTGCRQFRVDVQPYLTRIVVERTIRQLEALSGQDTTCGEEEDKLFRVTEGNQRTFLEVTPDDPNAAKIMQYHMVSVLNRATAGISAVA